MEVGGIGRDDTECEGGEGDEEEENECSLTPRSYNGLYLGCCYIYYFQSA
jgi:hypothetical protein